MTRARVWALVAFALGAAGAFLLAGQGVPLTVLPGGASLAGLLGVLLSIGLVYELSVLLVELTIGPRAGAPTEVRMVATFLRAVAGTAAVVVVFSFMGWLPRSWAVLAGFAGLLMGWSLQAPVSGLAAWALVNIKRPFRVGDRVTLPTLDLTGDVKQIGMMYTVLDQVGGTIGSEDITGRNILIPNAMLFGNIVINYTPRQAEAFVLDEVIVRMTYNSNWDLAESILLNAAREVTGDIIEQTGQEPYIRAEMYDYGVYMYLRYVSMATDRTRIAYEITRIIFKEFLVRPDVDFAMPYVFSHRTGMRAGARHLEPVREPSPESVDVDKIHDPSVQAARPDNAVQVQELAEKIREHGLLQPIMVEKRADGHYTVLSGDFRLAACKLLGWKTIPAIVRPAAPPPSG
jgi:small-conductance mechanosensitive channel